METYLIIFNASNAIKRLIQSLTATKTSCSASRNVVYAPNRTQSLPMILKNQRTTEVYKHTFRHQPPDQFTSQQEETRKYPK